MKATVAATTISYSLLTGVPSAAVSNEARFINTESNKDLQKLQQSETLGSPELFDDLNCLAEECAQPNWDGYDAAPITARTVDEASRFLSSMPIGAHRPSISAEPDGHISFEWHASSRRTLSVSIAPEGLLHYSALIGSSRHFGTEPFLGQFPRTLRELIRRIQQA